VLICALLFGLWHLYVGQAPIDAAISFVHTFVFGITAAILTLHYGNIGPALGLHIVWNVAGYFSAAAGGDTFWSAWAATHALPWTAEGIANGDLMRLLVFPLMIETLIIFAVCRDTLRKLLGLPGPMNEG
jgi:membrane protease YdiL (CAAX protease family)